MDYDFTLLSAESLAGDSAGKNETVGANRIRQQKTE